MFKQGIISNSFQVDSAASLYLGDCLDFLGTIPDESIQLIITSPPYNLGKEYEQTLDICTYVRQQKAVIDECVRVLRPTGSICWQVGNFVDKGEIVPLDVLLYSCFKNNGLQMRNRIIWHFGHSLHCSNRFSGRYETINWFTKSEEYTFNLDSVRVPQKYPGKKFFNGERRGQLSGNPKGKNPSDVWDEDAEDVWEGYTDFWKIPNVKSNHIEKTSHPCQFPVSLVQRLILSLSDEDDLVFDPFMGSGTTAIAAVVNRRKGVGSEIMPEYYDFAVDRVESALRGTLRVREDKPIYVPPQTLSLTQNAWHQGELIEVE